MTVRVYRWDDASAPVLTGEVGKLTALLKACLVTGYGSKTAAGWSNPYSATNIEAFTNNSSAGGTGYGIKVLHENALYANVVGYSAIDGSGVTTNTFPTTAQIAAGIFWLVSSTANTTARPWVVVADEKRFYLWVGVGVTTATGLATTSATPMGFAGDLIGSNPTDAYRFTVIGGKTSSATANVFGFIQGYVSSTPLESHYIARSFAGATVSKNCGKIGGMLNNNNSTMGLAGAAYPDPASGGMLLSRVYVHEGDASLVTRGYLPGLFSPQHVLPGNPGDTFSGTGALSGKTFILLDTANYSTRGRIALEISDTWE